MIQPAVYARLRGHRGDITCPCGDIVRGDICGDTTDSPRESRGHSANDHHATSRKSRCAIKR